MLIGDKTIYVQYQGAMVMVAEPAKPFNVNFVITWKGLDWSGFRTLEECVRQFPSLEKEGDNFAVVERF